MSKLDRIYASLPLSLQNQAVSIYGIYWHWLRFGGRYKAHEFDYRNRDHYTAAQWAEYQQAQLKKLILLASEKDRKSTRLNSSHIPLSRMPSSA